MKYDKEEKAILDAYNKDKNSTGHSLKEGNGSDQGNGTKDHGEGQANYHTSL